MWVPLCINYCLSFIVNYNSDSALALWPLRIANIRIFQHAARIHKAKNIWCWPKHLAILIKPSRDSNWAFQFIIFNFNCQLVARIKILHILPKLVCHLEQTFFCLPMYYFCLRKLVGCFVSWIKISAIKPEEMWIQTCLEGIYKPHLSHACSFNFKPSYSQPMLSVGG
jgi:hypothetical protein